MIHLRDYIGGSSVRECYRHPLFDDKCIKIVKNKKDLPGLLREVRVSKLVAPYLKDYIVEYDGELVETDKGLGLVCGLVRNDDGAVASALTRYQDECLVNLGDDIERDLREILRRLITHNLFFYDFNEGNFVVKETRCGGKKVVFIDLKGFHKNHYMGFRVSPTICVNPISSHRIYNLRRRRFTNDEKKPHTGRERKKSQDT